MRLALFYWKLLNILKRCSGLQFSTQLCIERLQVQLLDGLLCCFLSKHFELIRDTITTGTTHLGLIMPLSTYEYINQYWWTINKIYIVQKYWGGISCGHLASHHKGGAITYVPFMWQNPGISISIWASQHLRQGLLPTPTPPAFTLLYPNSST